RKLKKSMDEAKNGGHDEVVFTGGEPTLHPDFLDLVKYAKKTGFKEIQIQTNGRMFAYEDFCLKTIAAGATQFSPAVHGPNAKIHDFLTTTKGSFNQTTQGIKNLKKLNQYVLTNTVITSKNAQHLPRIAQLLVDLGVDQFQFAFIHISGTAKKNKDWIVPKKSEIMKYVKRGLDLGLKAKKRVMTEAIPYCLMEGYEEYIAERIIPPSVVYDAGFVVKNYGQYRKNKGKAKGPDCQKCKYFKICEGPWKEYPEIYGWDEFKPILK
ncbi:radical SAM protein, partial [Patescibacteria group bacterium]|nr:radical SAM protein [Patescibacteria group bacterium]